ncbi:MAG: rRNA ((1498)-N(3))-methyltransferase [Frankiales bacterium]|jgi:16S rRNA (uracil1498-N3)-methyltransferase|nr:rRNA ((1498)-N(3))-methyltransferase [Frankiales bacterium]
MTPQLFLMPELAVQPVAGDVIELTGQEARHAATVKRLELGEVVLLADGRGTLIEARSTTVGRDRISFAVLSVRAEPEPQPRFVVVQAVPKGERADLAVQALTELGADEIVAWSASRSISLWRGADKIDKGLAKWRRTALEASKQSRRARIPVVTGLASTEAIANRVSETIASGSAAFVLHEAATESLAGRPLPSAGVLLVIVGPEGGVSEEELQTLTTAGAVAVRLGPAVLRTSTAGAAALAVLSVGAGRWM